MIYQGTIKDRRHYKGLSTGYRAYLGQDLVFLGVKPYYGGEKWRIRVGDAWHSAECGPESGLTRSEVDARLSPITVYDWKELIIGECVKSIGNNLAAAERNIAAQNPSGLTSVTISDTVVEIQADAFQAQMLLTSVAMPSSLETIGMEAFNECTGITEYALMGQTHISTIGESAFRNNDSLVQAVLPMTITSIGFGAFEGAHGDSYTHTPLKNIRRFIIYAETPPNIGSYAFGDAQIGYHPDFEGFYVPDGSVAAYKAATNWIMYSDYIRPLSEYRYV